MKRATKLGAYKTTKEHNDDDGNDNGIQHRHKHTQNIPFSTDNIYIKWNEIFV